MSVRLQCSWQHVQWLTSAGPTTELTAAGLCRTHTCFPLRALPVRKGEPHKYCSFAAAKVAQVNVTGKLLAENLLSRAYINYYNRLRELCSRQQKKAVSGNPDTVSRALSCGGSTRTSDLQVMSLASYQLLHSAMLIFNANKDVSCFAGAKVQSFFELTKYLCSFFEIFHFSQLFCPDFLRISKKSRNFAHC